MSNRLPIALLILSIIIFSYIFFKSEIIFDGEKRWYYLIYYKIAGILIVFSIITFYFNKTLKTYLMISILSFIFSIYLFQTYLTISYGGVTGIRFIEKKIKRANEEGVKYDFRDKFEIYTELKKNKYNNLKIAVSPSRHINKKLDIFPLSGASNSPTLGCNENGYYTIFQSDRYGFNNLDSEWDQKEIEFFLIGDSFVFGNCVNRPHDISSVLRNLSNKPVVNIGYQNNGPLLEFAGLREYIQPEVKNIIWIYYETSDLENLSQELTSETLKKYIEDLNFKQDLIYKQNEIDKIIINLVDDENKTISQKLFENNFTFKVRKFIELWNVRELINYKLLRSGSNTLFNPPMEFSKIIELARNLANKNNSKFHFVYLPSYERYAGQYNDQEYNFIKKNINDLNINFIDIDKEVFKKENDPLKLFPFKLSGHYTIEGYRKVTEAIYNKVQ